MAVGTENDELQGLLARLALLENILAARDAELAARDAELATRDAKIAELMALVEQLTELLGQNSKNSHLPPSSDGPGASGGASDRPKSKPKSKSNRKRGGQKGHRGFFRALLPPEQVDTIVDLFPEVCLGCGRLLPKNADAEAHRHQQLDIRNYRPHVTEWRRHGVTCGDCGTCTRADYDRKEIPASAFGSGLTAVVVLLTGVYHLSRRKAQSLLGDLFGIRVSLGAISAMEKRATEAFKPAHDEVRQEVQDADVKHSDATSWLRSGKLVSLWTVATIAATYFEIFDDGRRETIRPMFGPPRGILVSDRATVFNFWSMEWRQVCWAHLLRRFVAFSERAGPAGALGRELLEATAVMFEYWHGYKDGLLTRQEFQQWVASVQRDLEKLLERGAKSDIKRLSGSCADILAHKEALWSFVTQKGVEPTNNHGESEIRDFVLWRKRSFGSQSRRGDRFAARVMTIARTARKQGRALLGFITDSLVAYTRGRPQRSPKVIHFCSAKVIQAEFAFGARQQATSTRDRDL